MSGRALRRLPVLALARYIGIGTSSTALALSTPSVKASKINNAKNGHTNGAESKSLGADVVIWLDAMEKVVQEQGSEHGKL